MSKELEAFRRFRANAIFDNQSEYYLSAYFIDDSDIIETALKALEIIKEKRVDISVLIESESLREYTDRICVRVNFGRPSEQNLTYLKLAQEEYDLLKEVLL